MIRSRGRVSTQGSSATSVNEKPWPGGWRAQVPVIGGVAAVIVVVGYAWSLWQSTDSSPLSSASFLVGFTTLAIAWLPFAPIGWATSRLLALVALVGLLAFFPVRYSHAVSNDLGETFGVGLLLLVAGLIVLVTNRQAWRAKGGVRIEVPLARGTYCVLQGGGRFVNHHVKAPSQRFALDLIGSRAVGLRTRGVRVVGLDDFLCFGAQVVSPVSGTVVSAADDIDDLGPRRPAGGNSVVLEPSSSLGCTIELAHLKKGSVVVRVGQTVAAGDPIGLVGTSGNSSEPHLHVHAQTSQGVGVPLFVAGRRPLARNAVVRTGRHRTQRGSSS